MSQIYEDPQRLTGQIFAGTLEVKSWQGRDRYEVCCQHCGTSSIYGIAQLKAASACPNRACSVTKINRPDTDRTEQRLPKLEKPKPLGSLKDFIEAERQEAEHKAAEKQKSFDAVIAKETQKAQKTLRELRAAEQEYLLKARDEDVFISPELKNARMSKADAERNNREQATAFIKENPDFPASPENSQTLLGYLERSGVQIFDVPILKAAWRKLADAGLIVDALTPEPSQYYGLPDDDDGEATVQPVQQFDRYTKRHLGRNPETFEEAYYSDAEIDRMDSDTFKQTFRVNRSLKSFLYSGR